jgi:hypothetical protein
MILIKGNGKFFIRFFTPLFYKCPYCDTENTTEVFIYSYYFHVFWIPVFPIKKVSTAKCTACESLRSEERFGPKLTDHVNEELKNTKHPFYSWTLLLLFGAIILLAIIISTIK